MGYRGKVVQREQARDLRAQNLTLQDIATQLGVSKSSVSIWVRDVPFTPSKRRHGPQRRPHPQRVAKLKQIEDLNAEGVALIGRLDDSAFLVAGVALYAGEGAKRDACVTFANSDPAMIRLHCAWLRHFFDVDEARLRLRVYLHQGLDLEAAEAFWSALTAIPRTQFHAPYRAIADPSIRRNKHENGCATVIYSCSTTHRRIMGLVRALLSSDAIPG
jgi:transcriptional regulator with XRE-family HTH domain